MIIEARLELVNGTLALPHAEVLVERRRLFDEGVKSQDIQIRLLPPKNITIYGHRVIDSEG